MPFIVYGPFSGKPVKVRDEDVGRAIRDEENRIFYVITRSNGDGYYTSPTRQGGAKDEQRYDAMMQKMMKSQNQAREEVAVVRDATGKRRSGISGKLVILVLFLIVAAIAYWTYKNLWGQWQKGPPSGDIPVTWVQPLPSLAIITCLPKAETWQFSTSRTTLAECRGNVAAVGRL